MLRFTSQFQFHLLQELIDSRLAQFEPFGDVHLLHVFPDAGENLLFTFCQAL